MNNFFNFDGPFFTILNRVSDLIILNVLWLICCIPIVTIGASTTAMYYVALKMVNNEESYVTRSFFKSFRENFRQSTIIWLIMLPIGILIAFNLYVSLFVEIRMSGILMNDILLPVSLLVAVFYVMTMFYVFPLQSKFVNQIRYTLKNALILSIRHLPFTVIFIAGTAAAVFLFVRFSIFIPIYLLFGCAAIAYCYAFLFMRIFRIYIKEEPEESDDPESAQPADAVSAESVYPLPDYGTEPEKTDEEEKEENPAK